SGLIANRLGWLEAPQYFAERIDELEAFAAGIRATGFQRAVVCGMGGSSLAPDVLARSFERGAGAIAVEVLDSTDPAAVAAVEAAGDPDRTLFLIATKSGTTSETLSFLEYFWALEDSRHGPIPESLPGDHFVAITDPGKSLEAIPHQDLFRSSFLNPEDVGGRYSALTYVGLVPAALLGVDLRALLGGAAAMAARCQLNGADNPGLALGTAMGALAAAGRDKLTLLIEPRYASFGAWLEQLIAESTGKHGVGIVPVDAEPLGEPASYGQDRVFVRLAGSAPDEAWAAESAAFLDALAATGHPVIDLRMLDSEGLGGEFFRWEFATAVAGAVLGINPFDEPNVTESKENTRRVLREFEERGELPHDEPIATTGPLAVYGDSALRLSAGTGGVGEELRRHLERARPSSYVAIQAYIAPSPQRDAALAALRSLIRDRTGLATTVGYGPRFLHSTGQLHKGGPRTGCFLQLTSGHPTDLQIPGAKETFGTLIDAQARGDFTSLEGHELPVARVDLSEDPDAGLAELHSILQGATKSPA
ncbi:MAG: transaldolase, partial [Chloroflexi bacterium]|nr:transaldolase [Chloroflexota bacterium]